MPFQPNALAGMQDTPSTVLPHMPPPPPLSPPSGAPPVIQFGSPQEAVAALEQGIQLLKSGQIGLRDLVTLMRAAMQVMMRGDHGGNLR